MQGQPNSTAGGASGSTSQAAQPGWVSIVFTIEGNLKFLFFPAVLFTPVWATPIAFIICVLGLLRTCKRPRWNVEYGEKALKSEFTHNMMYMLVFVMFPHFKNITFYIPLAVHFAIGVAEYSNLKKGFLNSKFPQYINTIRVNRNNLLEYKAKFEVFQLFFFIIFIFLNGISVLFLAFLYGNFLKMKYMLSPHTKKAFYEINMWIEMTIIASPSCPGFARSIINRIRSFVSSMGVPNT